MSFGQRMLQLRDEMKPSIEVAQRTATALGTTIDFLTGNSQLSFKGKKNLARIELLTQIHEKGREGILFVLDSLLRDAHQQRTQAQLAS